MQLLELHVLGTPQFEPGILYREPARGKRSLIGHMRRLGDEMIIASPGLDAYDRVSVAAFDPDAALGHRLTRVIPVGKGPGLTRLTATGRGLAVVWQESQSVWLQILDCCD